MDDEFKKKPLLKLVDYRNSLIAKIKSNKETIETLKEQLDMENKELVKNEYELICFNESIKYLENKN